jgi:hypothetical protein
MEKQGLDQALTALKDSDVKVDVLVTDGHVQIRKWLRENHPDIQHYFDVWHIAKSKYNYCVRRTSRGGGGVILWI